MANWLRRLLGARENSEDRSAQSAEQQNDPIRRALADREAETVLEELRQSPTRAAETPPSPEETARLAKRVSDEAYALIVRHETGGREYYEKVMKARPEWPEASSGVTIGFGYDLGYQASPESFKADWGGLLPDAHIQMLSQCVGLKAVAPNRDDKISQIKNFLAEFKTAGITIPWEPSETAFKKITLPNFAVITANALPGNEVLSDDCFGALVSLTFNRGPSYSKPPSQDPNDRYREMRAIKGAIESGKLETVAGQIRAMKRIWKGTTIEGEMNRRRENEARLFEEGLVPVVVAQIEQGAAAAEARGPTRGATRTIHGFPSSGTDDEAAEREDLERATRGIDFGAEIRRAAASVKWAPDEVAPDYAHLENKLPQGIHFKLRAADLAWLAELNAFPVEEAGNLPVLFGLRGCGIVDAGDDLGEEVELVDQRPDHRSTRCAMGVWDRGAGRIAVFPGSTVPHSDWVTKWYETRGGGNMLPTGCYRYIVGVHNGRPGCWVLRDRNGDKWTVAVRRSSNNLLYERVDMVDPCEPGDNLHPTFGSGPDWFSSAGCQVVLGSADENGNHKGPWSKFRRCAGLTTPTGKPNTVYVYMMLTGLEALLAARARRDGSTAVPEVRRSLMRLRFGSKGEKVTRLQKALGSEATGQYDLATALKVYAVQKEQWSNACDGIFSPSLDAKLNAGVFADLPPDTVAVASAPASRPEPASGSAAQDTGPGTTAI